MFAVCHGLICVFAGMMLIIHSIFPCFFEKAGSNLVKKLNLSFDRHENERQSKIELQK
jgi:hypothetical protein